MTAPIESDRALAVALLRQASADGLIEPTTPRKQPEMVERIAQAIADAWDSGFKAGRST